MPRTIKYKTVDAVVAHKEDFAPDMESGEYVASSSAAAVDSNGDPAAILGAVSDDGRIVTVPLQSGVEGEDYTITIQAVTDATPAQTIERIVELRVRDSGEERNA